MPICILASLNVYAISDNTNATLFADFTVTADTISNNTTNNKTFTSGNTIADASKTDRKYTFVELAGENSVGTFPIIGGKLCLSLGSGTKWGTLRQYDIAWPLTPNGVTMMSWIYYSSANSGGVFTPDKTVGGFGGDATPNRFALSIHDGYIWFGMLNVASKINDSNMPLIPFDTWVHVCGTAVNYGIKKYYLNGVQMGGDITTYPVSTDTGTLWNGMRFYIGIYGPTGTTTGTIIDPMYRNQVRLFNTVLTSEQIAGYYNNERGTIPVTGFKALGTDTSPKPLNNRVWSIASTNGVIYMCGLFSTIYNSNTRCYVATYTVDTDTWSVLGNGYFNGTDLSQVFVANGIVYVAGSFSSVEIVGKPTLSVAAFVRYNISTNTWSTIGTGAAPISTDTFGRGVVVDSSSTYMYFIGSGTMTSFNGTSATKAVRVTLSNDAVVSLTSGFPGGVADEIQIDSNNVPYISTTNNGVLKLNTSTLTWTTVGSGPPTNVAAYGIAFGPGGSTLLGFNNAVWYSANGSTGWSALGTSSGPFYGVAIHPTTGALYSASASANSPVRVWNGSAWVTFAAVSGYVRSIHFNNDRIYFGGPYNAIGGFTTTNAAVYF